MYGLTSGVTAISAGGAHVCAIVNGAAMCWGSNTTYGQLGNNSLTNSDVPVQVTGLTSNVSSISAGDSHTCAVVNGAVKCWGYNNAGASLETAPAPTAACRSRSPAC